VVLVDNGRTRALGDPVGRKVLRCIRCAACMHICPIYERVGGHAYGSVYPGPIGSVLTPQLRGFDSAIDKSLPYASSLCGACAEVCPVKIPIPDLLLHLRRRVVDEKKRGHFGFEQTAMRGAGWVMGRGSRLGFAGRLAGLARAVFRRDFLTRLPWLGKRWTVRRDLRMPARHSFRVAWRQHEKGGGHD
jgi:L-lactate dehydrogenase complex protein LldF